MLIKGIPKVFELFKMSKMCKTDVNMCPYSRNKFARQGYPWQPPSYQLV
jgi:hypothetical protein